MEATAAFRSSSWPEPACWPVTGGRREETNACSARWPRWGAVATLGVAASYFYSTGRGKLSVWKELLDELDLRGDEQVLDIGCGRGAVLISAARRLPQGRATGADIWRLRDQTGNSQAAAERNAMIEGVSERVDFVHAMPGTSRCPPGPLT